MKIFQHTLDSSNTRSDPNILEKWRDGTHIIKQMKQEGNMLYQEGNWLVHTKGGPYSDKDLQVTYVGDDRSISNIEQLDVKDLMLCQTLLSQITSCLENRYLNELNEGRLQLILGINTGMNPGAGKTQSVFRPHFHITLLSNEIGTDNNIVTSELELSNWSKKKMALNEQNLDYIKRCGIHLSNNYIDYEPGFDIDGKFYAIDIPCTNFTSLANEDNIELFQQVHSLVYSFCEIERDSLQNGILDESVDFTTADYNMQQLGFTTLLYREGNTYYIRIKFAHKNIGEDSGMVEASGGIGKSLGRIITRNNVDTPFLPDMEKFKELIIELLNK